MKQLLLLAFALGLLHQGVLAQKQDSIAPPPQLLLIPALEEYYLSDADQEIAAKSKRDPESFRFFFRKSLDLRVAAEMETICPVTALLQDTSRLARKQLELYYASISMKYAAPVYVRKEDKKESRRKEKEKPKAYYEDQTAPNYARNKGEVTCMQVGVRDTAKWSRLMAATKSQFVLAITQLEIKTNYNSCIDIANKIYRREFMVHYTLLDVQGKVLAGNVVTAFFPSNSNRDEDIVARCIPVVSTLLKEQITPCLTANNQK